MPFAIYDNEGNPRDMDWLVANYGPVVGHAPMDDETWAWRVVEVRENKQGKNFVLVTVLDAEGNPVAGKKVSWYYSSAHHWDDNPCGPIDGLPPGMVPDVFAGPGTTNPAGLIGLGMSFDGQYEPPDIGPYGFWICTEDEPTMVVYGLGWLRATSYHHLDVTVQWSQGDASNGELLEELEAAQTSNAETAQHIANAIALAGG